MPSNLEAAQSGDRRRALEVLRDTLAEKLDTTTSEVHAQLAARYQAVLKELDELEPAKGASARERFAARVAASQSPL